MGGLKQPQRGVIRKGRTGFGAGCSVTFDRDLTIDASATDALNFITTALREWYAEAHATGQHYASGELPRDAGGGSWVGYDTGLTAGTWDAVVSGDDVKAGARVFMVPPDRARRLRFAQLAKQGIRFAGLDGRALEVYQRAMAQYMSGVIS
jgi:hypothetical protein